MDEGMTTQLGELIVQTGKNGVDDGARTHDNRNHNPGLYQLSYVHHNSLYAGVCLARPAGFEPATLGLEGRCSIQMSYGRRTRTAFIRQPAGVTN